MNELTAVFEDERVRLLRLAERILADHAEAEDIVQQAWLRLAGTAQEIDNVPAWLTTVTTRLCLDRLRAKTPIPDDEIHDSTETYPDPAEEVVLAGAVGAALQVVLDSLTPRERVAFVLHESFGFDFATIAAILDTSVPAARKLASRARTKVTPPSPEAQLADWEVVDAFLVAAREGDFSRLLDLLAPDVVVTGDQAAVALGTPERITGRQPVAEFFNGAAKAAFGVFLGDRPGAAWIHRGEARVAFDFTIVDGRVSGITFRAAPEILASVRRRKAGAAVQ
ncbi:sigma-70 family RNA polymerase sigma factor [Brevibacterium daeguense]|uniref:Sigma-70 family RNA polymerase sigma factor n=1 Tax=Brevibacterium daeguense TaxID=909936 RepID=A0ABP8EIL6_9MICO|nr:sigma-70 family RNA polymerase sigma factor [Brevibacterium daeguense]